MWGRGPWALAGTPPLWVSLPNPFGWYAPSFLGVSFPNNQYFLGTPGGLPPPSMKVERCSSCSRAGLHGGWVLSK